MNQGRTTKQNMRRDRYERTEYMYDSTARDLEIRRELEEIPVRQPKARPVKRNHVNPLTILMYAVTFCLAGYILYSYLSLENELKSVTKEVAKQESLLNSLKTANNEAENRVESRIDIEEIKRIAIGELGMTYAEAGQIQTYSSVGTDYMRKVSEE